MLLFTTVSHIPLRLQKFLRDTISRYDMLRPAATVSAVATLLQH